jgi:hypothetical protein
MKGNGRTKKSRFANMTRWTKSRQATSKCGGFGIAAAVLAASLPGAARSEPPPSGIVLGHRPASVTRPLSQVPNAHAIVRRIWAPGIDDGFVPQGLAIANGELVLSAYRSTDRKQGRGPCRVFVIAPKTGAVTRSVDLPATCGHAGGVATLPDGRIVVADTFSLYVISGSAVAKTVTLKGRLRGSFADADGQALWIGSYDRSGGTLWRLPPEALDKSEIDESDADAVLAIPPRVQGLAFDRGGGAWLTVSGSQDGALLRLDPKTGAIPARYPMPPGIEDIAVDSRGLIWAVSEAGSIRWSHWSTNFPVVFAIDPARLR